MSREIGFEVQLKCAYDQAVEHVIARLKAHGFGVLTRIDAQATFKEKLGVDFRPYTILGACNPPLAHRALSQDPAAGLILPCNVTVEENPSGEVLVRIANPEAMLQVGYLEEDKVLKEIAAEARGRLEKVMQELLEEG